MAGQIDKDDRKPPLGVEHDRTVPPLGITIAAHVKPMDDGHHPFLLEYDLFSEPIPINLPTDEVGYCQFSEKTRHPFRNAELNTGEQITIGVDFGNFESPDKIDEFFHVMFAASNSWSSKWLHTTVGHSKMIQN